MSAKDTRQFWAAAIALFAVLLAPFFLVDVPPVLDYPNHLARYVVLAHPADPVFAQFYAPHWRIVPNLGMDVIATGLLKIVDVRIGGRLLLALSLLAPIIGVVVYSRFVFGRLTLWPLASGAVAYNAVFQLGFMNFLLSLGLALAGAGVWIAMRMRRAHAAAAVIGALAGTVIFFCHIFGVALFALLIGTWEAAQLRGEPRLHGLVVRLAVLRRAALLAVVLAPAIALYFLSPLSGDSLSAGTWDGPHKLWAAFAPVMTTMKMLTVLCGLALFVCVLLLWRGARFAPGIRLAMVVLGIAFLIAPPTLKGGTFVEIRLAVMLALLPFAGMSPRWTPHRAAIATIAIALLVAVHAADIATAWSAHARDIQNIRQAIEPIQPGERVMVARGKPGNEIGEGDRSRGLPGIYRLDGHLGALLLIERKAFWPLMFADASQQPLIVKPPYDRLAEPLGEPVEWPTLRKDAFTAAELGNARYLSGWRSNFDHVLLIDPPADPSPLPQGLKAVRTTPYAILYQVTSPR